MSSNPSSTKAHVVLVHGLLMHGMSLYYHRQQLQAHGFEAHLFSYASVTNHLQENIKALQDFIAQLPQDGMPIHLVGHSQGGLLILGLLAQEKHNRLERVVLLGSPIAGSQYARAALKVPLLSMLVGHSIPEWMDNPLTEIPSGCSVGMIAGNSGIGTGMFVPGLQTPHDGVVSVAETTLPGLHQHIQLPINHLHLMFSQLCAQKMLRFLEHGHF